VDSATKPSGYSSTVGSSWMVETNLFPSLSDKMAFSSFDNPIACSSSANNSQFMAASTAALASTIPKPYQLECQKPAPFTIWVMSSLSFSTFREVWAKIPWTSLQESSGLASSISAMTPDTTGQAKEVPCPESAHVSTPRPAVIMWPMSSLSPAGATTTRAAPAEE